MIYKEKELENEGVLQTAKRMCVAARTAPKARGVDFIHTAVVTGEELMKLADETERLGKEQGQDFYVRDAGNLRNSQAVVLVGATYQQRGLNECCGWCHQTNCQGCRENQSVCVFDPMDLGIALGSAVSVASMDRVDNRIMFSIGKGAASLEMLGPEVKMILGIPLSATGKAPYFDRKK